GLTYDITQIVGDTIPNLVMIGDVFTVDSVDSVSIGNIYRKRISAYGMNGDHAFIIEGIGASTGLLQMMGHIPSSANSLSCYSEYGTNLIGGCIWQFVNVETLPQPELQIYPNPVKSENDLFLESGTNTSASIQLMDMTGKIIKSFTINTSSFRLPINLPAGQYILVLQTEDGFTSRKKMVVIE